MEVKSITLNFIVESIVLDNELLNAFEVSYKREPNDIRRILMGISTKNLSGESMLNFVDRLCIMTKNTVPHIHSVEITTSKSSFVLFGRMLEVLEENLKKSHPDINTAIEYTMEKIRDGIHSHFYTLQEGNDFMYFSKIQNQ
jgi:hypothetical protein